MLTRRLSLTPRFIEVLEWAIVVVTVSTVLGPPDKPLKRFRVERRTDDTQLKLGVNEKSTRPVLNHSHSNATGIAD